MAKKSSLHMPLLALSILVSTCVSTALGAAEISGEITLLDQGKRLKRVEDVVVYFRPDDHAAAPALAGQDEYVMGTRKKAFDPQVLAVPVGASVRFPNRDPILHNVFSVSGGNQFDAGLIPKGAGRSHRFTEAGHVRVFCNVHQEMTANILVLETLHFVYPDRRGRYTLEDIPDVPGTLVVWHERASESRHLTPGEMNTLDLELNLVKRRVPNHKNKFGRSYKTRGRRGRY